MRTFIATLLLLIYMPAQAQDSGLEPLAAIQAAAEHYVAGQLGGDAQAQASDLDDRLRLAACPGTLNTSTFGAPANSAWTVQVSCAEPAWKLYVPVRVKSVQPVVIVKRNLRAGEILGADALELARRDTARLNFGFLSDPSQAVGRILREPVSAGMALSPEAIAVAPSIHRGQTVTLLSRAGAIEVRAQGKALSDGGAGQRIRVENESSRRIIEGSVTPDGNVEVGL